MTDSPLHLVLCQPEIPPNTGNIIRLCANTGCTLHLIEPLGFELDDTRLRRAGLDYHEFATVQIWDELAAYRQAFSERRLIGIETSGQQPHAAFGLNPVIHCFLAQRPQASQARCLRRYRQIMC